MANEWDRYSAGKSPTFDDAWDNASKKADSLPKASGKPLITMRRIGDTIFWRLTRPGKAVRSEK